MAGQTGPKAAPGVTRQKVKELYEQGFSQNEIAERLGLSKGSVAFHVRRFGVPIDARFAKRYDWAEIRKAYEGGLTYRECRRRFGFSSYAWYYAVKRGDIVPQEWRIPLEALLVVGRKTSRGHLKNRLLEAGLLENRCAQCGIDTWGESL